jgi:hypothetical protein
VTSCNCSTDSVPRWAKRQICLPLGLAQQPVELVQDVAQLAPRRPQPAQLSDELGPRRQDLPERLEHTADVAGVERTDRSGATQLVDLRRRQRRGSRHGGRIRTPARYSKGRSSLSLGDRTKSLLGVR